MAHRSVFFRIVYGSTYFVLYIILCGLLLITPGDIIQRSVVNNRKYNIWILTVAYIVTTVVVCFVYVLRLYINKTVLASIPKSWIPIDKGDVKEPVYRMIGTGLSRSAVIAYAARPRVRTGEKVSEEAPDEGHARTRLNLWKTKTKTTTTTEELSIALPPHRPVWGTIEHCGWASPNSADLPNLQYSDVLSEVPNLIEAKALTLAPPDPTWQTEPPILDLEAAGLLQRLPNMSLRDYFGHLADLGVIVMDQTAADFLSQYEFARFSTRPLSNARFRELMHLFAEILRYMRPLDPTVLDPLDEEDDESDTDDGGPAETSPPTPRSLFRPSTSSTYHSVRRPATLRNAYRTAPNTPGSRQTMDMTPRKSGGNGFAQTRRPYPVRQPSSSASLRSKSSDGSGSVIRLATREDSSSLPYVLSLRDTVGTQY